MDCSVVSVSAVDRITRLHLTGVLPGVVCDGQELIYIESGAVIVSIDGECFLLKAGELLFCRPYAYRSLQPRKDADVVLLSFRCDSPMIQELDQKIFSGEPFHFSTLLQEVNSQEFGSKQMVKNAMEQVLILCLRHGGLHWQERAVCAIPMQQHAWIVHQVMSYLHAHYAQRITLELLANLHDISMTQLKRIFKEQTGTTIISYLTDYRMDRAKELIRNGSMSFTQIADAVGYDNIYYFSTQFKKQTGMTPTEYSKTQNL